jgi:hypothetical protein
MCPCTFAVRIAWSSGGVKMIDLDAHFEDLKTKQPAGPGMIGLVGMGHVKRCFDKMKEELEEERKIKKEAYAALKLEKIEVLNLCRRILEFQGENIKTTQDLMQACKAVTERMLVKEKK